MLIIFFFQREGGIEFNIANIAQPSNGDVICLVTTNLLVHHHWWARWAWHNSNVRTITRDPERFKPDYGIYGPWGGDLAHVCISLSPPFDYSPTISTNVPLVLHIRAQWDRCWGPKSSKIETGHLFSIVKLNFNVGLFSCIFWFEAIFLCKSAIFCRSLFTREKGPK